MMGRKRQSGCVGFLILVAIIGGLAMFNLNPIAITIGVVVVLFFLALAARPASCDICGGEIKRATHEVVIDGDRKRACANCAGLLRKQRSRKAVKDLTGDG